MFTVGDNMHYYAVDHSPSYLWDSATWEISEALLPFLRTVIAGPDAWDADETIRRAIEIRDGVIAEPAHPVLPGSFLNSPAPSALAARHRRTAWTPGQSGGLAVGVSPV